jgi:aspartate aminotransferase
MFSEKVVSSLKNSSTIRAMFEEGERLKGIYGEDKVFDFTIGNPDPDPPLSVKETMKKIIMDDKPGIHRYMSNAGYMDVREKVAAYVADESGLPFTASHIVMTCGAAGGLNIILKSILNPGEEVITFAPYFVEYGSYVENYGGELVVSAPDIDTFEPDLKAFEEKINAKTKAIIINSPNNPTGVIYKQETLEKMSDILEAKEKEFGTTIYVISDEPYNKLVYDGVKLPNALKIFQNSILCYSFSKSISLPGQRIGYVAASPRIEGIDILMDALIYANRVLGYVNAPAFFQRVVAENLGETVDIDIYQKRRDLLFNHLINLGFSCIKPQGAFYLFPKALIPDDGEFLNRALKYNLLFAAGKGFGFPGYFRIAYCTSLETIEKSLPAFEALANEFK